ncbi:MAG TPA: hypothetical protein PLD25_32030 [Chloroflexota bacterium]|nr:hypothetical protein [Chloroflexota bacterium]
MGDVPTFARLLEDYLKRNGRTPAWLAAQLSLDPETVVNWLSGRTYPDNPALINQIFELLYITDRADQEEMLRPPTFPTRLESNRPRQTNFYAPVYGPIHTGSGDININPLSPAALQEWLTAVFHWYEAPEHMRSSWAGRLIWLLGVVTEHFTPQRWLVLLMAIILWTAVAWLLSPILQWPLDDPQTRLWACTKYAVASLAIPFLIGSISQADYQPDFKLQTGRDHLLLWYLKVTGALVGLNVFVAILLFVSIGVYYLTLTTLPAWIWWLLLLVPLLFAYVVAKRIPADRYRMFNNELRAHEADRLFFATFLLFGPCLAAFVYLFYNFLAERITGLVLLLCLLGLTLWEQRRQTPKILGDLWIILITGLFLPLTAFLLYRFFSDQFDMATLSTAEDVLATLLLLSYIVGTITLWMTLLVKNKPVLTLKGAIGFLLIVVILMASLQQNLMFGRGLTLSILILWGIWGRKWFRKYLHVHLSFPLMLISMGLSFYMAGQTAVPLWLNLLGFVMITLALIYWASRPSSL